MVSPTHLNPQWSSQRMHSQLQALPENQLQSQLLRIQSLYNGLDLKNTVVMIFSTTLSKEEKKEFKNGFESTNESKFLTFITESLVCRKDLATNLELLLKTTLVSDIILMNLHLLMLLIQHLHQQHLPTSESSICQKRL